ncbi:MAG: hypothetical protein Ct9H90mP19_5530 [Gammaproteobacteria bacterium]|nr:MAG: hypothetical protein Ct9H90mP19_5530 [Gammaproteobacteria bacterium]
MIMEGKNIIKKSGTEPKIRVMVNLILKRMFPKFLIFEKLILKKCKKIKIANFK